MKKFRFVALPALMVLSVAPSADAWGNQGHRLIAAMAWRLLTPATRNRVSELLAADHDTLTGPDFVDRATWADAERSAEGGNGVSHTWHYVSVPPGLTTADEVYSALRSNESLHPDAVTKVRQFETDLTSNGTSTAQKIVALKYLIHLAGDLSQPLHTTADAGGNCITVQYGRRTGSLHQFWDDETVYDQTRRRDVVAAAGEIGSEITPEEIHAWSSTEPATWALDSYAVAMNYAYRLPGPMATCQTKNETAPIDIGGPYRTQADQVARLQLKKAAVRLAFTLNSAFDR